jgi:CrcB protein
MTWVGVAVLGALGAYARFAVGELVNLRRPGSFPAGTFVVNVTGAFALGLLTGLSVTGDALLVLGAGLLGSYTTFSTWMVEARALGGRRMAVYVAGSMAAGLVAAGAGWITAAAAAAAWA